MTRVDRQEARSIVDRRLTGWDPLDAVLAHPSAILLFAQLTAILAYPFLDGTVGGRAIIGVVQLVAVLAAVAAVRRTSALTWIALLLGGPATVLAVIEAIDRGSNDTVVLLSALFHVPFYFYVSYAMIRYLFHDDRVTRDEIFATGAAFTVVAWGFAYVFAAAQVIWPGSFAAGTVHDQSWFELLFLSFTTLTSVGLSDIVPIGDHARSLVVVEQVAGVFYVALVVSRLVGLTVRQRSEH